MHSARRAGRLQQEDWAARRARYDTRRAEPNLISILVPSLALTARHEEGVAAKPVPSGKSVAVGALHLVDGEGSLVRVRAAPHLEILALRHQHHAAAVAATTVAPRGRHGRGAGW